jgi:hypothetical protein
MLDESGKLWSVGTGLSDETRNMPIHSKLPCPTSGNIRGALKRS